MSVSETYFLLSSSLPFSFSFQQTSSLSFFHKDEDFCVAKMAASIACKMLWLLLFCNSSARARLAAEMKDSSGKLIDLDHVSMSKEAAELRAHHLNRKKPILKKSDDITSLLFPGASPVNYREGDDIPLFVELVESRKTQIPFD